MMLAPMPKAYNFKSSNFTLAAIEEDPNEPDYKVSHPPSPSHGGSGSSAPAPSLLTSTAESSGGAESALSADALSLVTPLAQLKQMPALTASPASGSSSGKSGVGASGTAAAGISIGAHPRMGMRTKPPLAPAGAGASTAPGQVPQGRLSSRATHSQRPIAAVPVPSFAKYASTPPAPKDPSSS